MKMVRRIAIALAAGGYGLAAQAALVTYDINMQATGIGDITPAFGISSLPAGPFKGSLSLESPLTSNEPLVQVALTSFELSVGDFNWTLADIFLAEFSVDGALGVNPTSFLIFGRHDLGDGKAHLLRLSSGTGAGVDWDVIDGRSTDYCAYATSPPYVGPTSGACIGGGPGTVTLTERQEVPEPPVLLLMTLGFLGIAAQWRKIANHADASQPIVESNGRG